MAQKKPLTVSESADVSMSIETVSGKLINPTNPNPDNISIIDIAWALSRIPRFAGHTITQIPYNVAQHSIYVSELVDKLLGWDSQVSEMQIPEDVLTALSNLRKKNLFPDDDILVKALFHDAHEAYFGDIPSPIKKIPELTETFKLIEMKLDHAIRCHFQLTELTDDQKIIIKFCDKLAQAIEGYQFMPSRGLNWVLPKPTLVMLQQFPQPLAPLDSYKAFLDRFEFLNAP